MSPTVSTGQEQAKRMSAEETRERSFAQLILEGKTKAALCLLCNKDTGCPLSLDDIIDTGTAEGRYVLDILGEKHPPAEPTYPESPVHHVVSFPEGWVCPKGCGLGMRLFIMLFLMPWMPVSSGMLHCAPKELLVHH